MELEEEAARLRWEEMELDRLKTLCALPGYDAPTGAEPYMTGLYDEVANSQKKEQSAEEEYRRCKDPVYNHSREWWQVGIETEPMEHQYGLMQQMMWAQQDLYAPRRQEEDHEML